MNASKMNTPAATTTTTTAAASAAPLESKMTTAPKQSSMPTPVEVEDEEVRIAMEMAIAAAQNPNLSPDELHKLVGEKNKQAAIVDKVQQNREEQKRKEREEAQKRWKDQKEKAVSWWAGKAESVKETAIRYKEAAEQKSQEMHDTAARLKEAAEQKAEEMKDRAERRLYAETIKKDPEYQELRKKIKVMQKTLKAHRLQGNRVETRHAFKRQRQERKLLQLSDKVDKTKTLFVDSNFNIHEYAKAMMKASRKWRKKGTEEELKLEAMLCRNMHQMLSIEKQKSQLKKSTREMKKYLQRCKGWLSDKKAICEMHGMTLEATHTSMQLMYEDTLKQQDALIAKLKASEEFEGVDLEEVELDNWKALSSLGGRANLNPSATLNALRGLPINDSIRIKKDQLDKQHQQDNSTVKPPPPSTNKNAAKPPPPSSSAVAAANTKAPELFIETKDDASVSSHLSDPDDEPQQQDQEDASLNDSGSDQFQFGNDAPWMAKSSSDNLNAVAEEAEAVIQQDFSKPLGLSDSKAELGVDPLSPKKPSLSSDSSLSDEGVVAAQEETTTTSKDSNPSEKQEAGALEEAGPSDSKDATAEASGTVQEEEEEEDPTQEATEPNGIAATTDKSSTKVNGENEASAEEPAAQSLDENDGSLDVEQQEPSESLEAAEDHSITSSVKQDNDAEDESQKANDDNDMKGEGQDTANVTMTDEQELYSDSDKEDASVDSEHSN